MGEEAKLTDFRLGERVASVPLSAWHGIPVTPRAQLQAPASAGHRPEFHITSYPGHLLWNN